MEDLPLLGLRAPGCIPGELRSDCARLGLLAEVEVLDTFGFARFRLQGENRAGLAEARLAKQDDARLVSELGEDPALDRRQVGFPGVIGGYKEPLEAVSIAIRGGI